MATHTRTLINGWEATVEIDEDDGAIDAYYVDGEGMAEECSVVIPAEEVDMGDGVCEIPEQIDADSAAHALYFGALVAFAAEVSGVAADDLADAFHPDVFEPCVRYRP